MLAPLQQIWRYFPAQVVALAMQLFALLLWARLLPLGEIGRLTLVVAVQEILFALTLMGWSQYMLRFGARHEIGAFRQTEQGVLAGSILLQGLLTVLALPLVLGPDRSGALNATVIGFVITRSLAVYLSERARADDDALAYTCLQALFPALALLLSVVAITKIAPTAQSVLLAMTIAYGAGLIFVGVRSRSRRVLAWPDYHILRSGIVFGLPVTLAALAASVAINAPRFMVEQQLGIAAAGLFAVFFGLGLRVASGVVMLVSAGAYPLAARKMEAGGTDAGHHQLAENIAVLAMILFPAVAGFIAVAPSFALLFLPEAFQEMARTMLPLAALFGLLRYARSHSTDQVFLLHGRSEVSMRLSILELMLITGLSATGIAFWGIGGAFVGAVFSALICGVISVVIARRRFGFVFPVSPVLRCALAACGMLLALQFVPTAQTLPAFLLTIAVGALIYGVCLTLACLPMLALSMLQSRFRRGEVW